MAAPASLQDNANGVRVTRTITYILRCAQDRLYDALNPLPLRFGDMPPADRGRLLHGGELRLHVRCRG